MTDTATYEHLFITNDGPIFNMIEDERGDIFWGYGHRDPSEFVNEVMRWFQHCNVGPELGEPHPSGVLEQSVEHLWAKLNGSDGPDDENFTLVKDYGSDALKKAADVFPVTRLWL